MEEEGEPEKHHLKMILDWTKKISQGNVLAWENKVQAAVCGQCIRTSLKQCFCLLAAAAAGLRNVSHEYLHSPLCARTVHCAAYKPGNA
jgi:hypothetical protein